MGATERAPAPALDPRRVVTPLDPDKIECLLKDLGILEQWAHIVHGIRHGFDVGIREPVTKTRTFQNHASAALDTAFIESYIAEEQAAGRYSEAFEPGALESAIGCFRTAPLGLVPKPNSDKMRLIQDLSYPRNDVCPVSTATRVAAE